ncbi:hypothetical protein [Prosthecobacter sp.]|uniref:hypothetical protein n=1 Tax=Prosthecobacter sp. TaxID=1965333 RepID=UPI002AB96C64|nr:hypothetical protein [Prosthecobacter sp.]MDZ4406306.1 hypothetical protein [Prosthecobacter sp.]
MSLIRLIFAIAACLLLSSCSLINTALRLAPLLMLVEESKEAGGGKSMEMRGRQVEDRGMHGILPADRSTNSGLAFKR